MSNDIKTTQDTDVCVLCGAEFTSFMDRNNPYPVAETGDCCGACNWSKVIPARLERFGLTVETLGGE